MEISSNGKNLIKSEEGFRASLYQDCIGIWTIGYGHRILPVDHFQNPLTEQEADDVLMKDLDVVQKYINHFCPGLTQNQYDALCDFGINLGVEAIHEMLTHGVDQVPVQIVRWDHAKGKVVQGLLDRRLKELSLWNTA